MLISLDWLSQYISIDGLSPESIAEALTHSGLEVESIEQTGGKFAGVVLGKIIGIDKHPNADKLRLVTVDLKTETHQVVCGAPNVAQGMLVAFAKEGATVINRKDGSTFVLGKATIRGVESAGMLCSLDELGLQDSYPKTEDGIWSLADLLSPELLGQDLKQALNLDTPDTILDIAPTANRGDQMSMMGVAREVAALFDRDFHAPEVKSKNPAPGKADIFVNLTDPTVCTNYTGAILKNVKIGPSPSWMARRLEACGVRSINNVVDITNYVMLETGQPLHAFDKIRLGYAGELGVRRAKAGETLTTLDGVNRPLTTEAVVITLNERPVALAGLMGGAESEINEGSQQIVLESAYFPPVSNRRSAKSVGLRTEASARFERGVDPEGAKAALNRAVELLLQHASAELVHWIDCPSKLPAKNQLITLRFSRIEEILGVSIEKETVLKILKKLGFLFQPTKGSDNVQVCVPTFRQSDVIREIDVIEEVIRIYGYDKIPYTLPQKTLSVSPSTRSRLLLKLRTALSGSGLQEVVTTSLIGSNLLEKTGFKLDENKLVSVTNSHSEDHTMLRQTLIPNLLEIAKFNQAQGSEAVWIYELGRTYLKQSAATEKHTGVQEQLFLSALLTGSVRQGAWHGQESVDFYTAKGLLEKLLGYLQLTDEVVFEASNQQDFLHPGKTARLVLTEGKKALGYLGELHPSVQDRLKFKQPVYVFELNIEVLANYLKKRSIKAVPAKISAFQAVKRDMAFLAPDSLTHQQIVGTLQKLKNPLLQQIELFDEYRSKELTHGHRSLAYRLTLQSDTETLTDAVIDQAMAQAKEALSQQHSVTFR